MSDLTRHTIDANVKRGLLKGVALVFAVIATIVGIIFFVPEETDYASATLRKQQRLEDIHSRKIVLVGGSNLSFGIDSRIIHQATGCPVVNMGINGYLGVRYMLKEVEARLKPSDVVVLSFEFDNFFKSVDGTAASLLAVVLANPKALSLMSADQLRDMIGMMPYIAQFKTLRMFDKVVEHARTLATGKVEDYRPVWVREMRKIETALAFTAEGDLTSHLGRPWPYPRLDGEIPANAQIESQALDMMRDFAQRMEQRGVAVIVSYTPTVRDFYDRHETTLNEIHERIGAKMPFVAPSAPAAFAYDDALFFDTVYHLNSEGRALRTRRLISDLASQLGDGDAFAGFRRSSGSPSER